MILPIILLEKLLIRTYTKSAVNQQLYNMVFEKIETEP